MIVETQKIGNSTLYRGDSLSLIQEIGGCYAGIDAIVTDPPYGINRKKSGHKVIQRLGGIEGDDKPFDPAPYLIAHRHIFWGGNHYSSRLPDGKRWLMWLKHDQNLFGKRSTSPFELAWTDIQGADRAFRFIWDGSIKQGISSGTQHQHPTEKPVELMAWCLEQLGDDGHFICDPFMGSGTTGVACAKLGRKFIGIEIEPKYFDISCKRIEKAYAQGDMFIEPPNKTGQAKMDWEIA